jgi:hypothetical protein
MSESITVSFGNTNPMMTHEVRDDDGTLVSRVQRPAKHINQSVTSVSLWPGIDDPDFVERALSTDNDRLLSMLAKTVSPEHRNHTIALHEVEQIVQTHAGGAKPAWVASSDSSLQAALAKHFDCPQGEPTALLTSAGRDALHAQHIGTSAQPAAFFYGALTANTGGGFASGDTTLAGEITTAGGALVRGAMTYAHTSGTNTSTLTKTWAANGTDALPVTIASWANFNAASVGTIGEEDPLSATATLSVSGDSLTVTFTLTAG